MRHTAPGQGPEGFRDSPVRDQLAYIHAEQMLDRYGITYVYQHPEVLLGIAPGSSLADRTRASYLGLGYRVPDAYAGISMGDGSHGTDGLLARVVEAYRILDEIFAPHRAASAGRQGTQPHSYRPTSRRSYGPRSPPRSGYF